MIPDKVMREMYLSKEFRCIPCMIQSLAIDAFEDALKKANCKIVEVENDATIYES